LLKNAVIECTKKLSCGHSPECGILIERWQWVVFVRHVVFYASPSSQLQTVFTAERPTGLNFSAGVLWRSSDGASKIVNRPLTGIDARGKPTYLLPLLSCFFAFFVVQPTNKINSQHRFLSDGWPAGNAG